MSFLAVTGIAWDALWASGRGCLGIKFSAEDGRRRFRCVCCHNERMAFGRFVLCLRGWFFHFSDSFPSSNFGPNVCNEHLAHPLLMMGLEGPDLLGELRRILKNVGGTSKGVYAPIS